MHLTENIKEVIAVLKRGGIIVYPTDTAYGLGAKFSAKSAESRIYKIKNRPAGKPLPVIVASLAMAKKFFRFSAQELGLAKKYWPGPLSLVLKFKSPPLTKGRRGGVTLDEYNIHKGDHSQPSHLSLARGASTKEGRVVRVPDCKIARKLSRAAGVPIISTSANISGAGECYSPKEVARQFQNKKYKPDFIFDGGHLRRKKPSTIIRVVGGKIEVLRQGPIEIKN